jgi:predicted nucleotidyltransferase
VDSEIAAALRRYFDEHAPEIAAAYLFGSTARRTAGPDSDVDVAVLPAHPTTGTLESIHLDVEDAIERLLGRPVQVVALHLAPVDLVHRVLRDGVLVCDRDRSKRIAFEVRARNDYFDLLPILDRYRRRAS